MNQIPGLDEFEVMVLHMEGTYLWLGCHTLYNTFQTIYSIDSVRISVNKFFFHTFPKTCYWLLQYITVIGRLMLCGITCTYIKYI